MTYTTVIGKDLNRAAEILRSNELVAIPTETVYGLAGNGLAKEAVLKIFSAKNRPFFDPLILHIGDVNMLEQLVESIPDACQKLIDEFWPGPLTVILPKKHIVPDVITSGSEFVAVRMPKHPQTLELLKSLPFPLAAPSANPFKYVSPTTAQHVYDQLAGKIPYILDGGSCPIGIESTIVSFFGDDIKIQRLGGISVDEIGRIIPHVILATKPEEHPVAPGQLKHHYAPGCKLFPLEKLGAEIIQFDSRSAKDSKMGIVLFSEVKRTEIEHSLIEYGVDLNRIQWYFLSPLNFTAVKSCGIDSLERSKTHRIDSLENSELNKDISFSKSIHDVSLNDLLAEATKNLFSTLRKLDNDGLEMAFFEWAPAEGLGLAINDRLKKAQYLQK